MAKIIDLISKYEADNPSVEVRLGKQTKFDANLVIHYTHVKRFQSNNGIYDALKMSD
jgi:hypothetical protein